MISVNSEAPVHTDRPYRSSFWTVADTFSHRSVLLLFNRSSCCYIFAPIFLATIQSEQLLLQLTLSCLHRSSLRFGFLGLFLLLLTPNCSFSTSSYSRSYSPGLPVHADHPYCPFVSNHCCYNSGFPVYIDRSMSTFSTTRFSCSYILSAFIFDWYSCYSSYTGPNEVAATSATFLI